MKLQYRVATAVASTALMLNLLAPAAFASTTVEISDNGSHSNNTANVTNNNSVSVNQVSNTTVSLNISTKSSTGGNKANDNTGGDVSITTGDASANTTVNVTGGANIASVNTCGCDNDTNVTVTGNGKKTNNKSIVKNTDTLTANQIGNFVVAGSIKTKAKTGKNKASGNTNGTVDVSTGGSDSSTMVDVTSPVNVLNP